MNEAALDIICEYIYKIDPGQPPDISDSSYQEACIMTWAAGEVLKEVMNNPNTPAAITVERFMVKMDVYHYIAENPNNKIAFEVARDTADDIGLMLI